MHLNRPATRAATWWFASVLGSILLALAAPAASQAEGTEDNPNNYRCFGHIAAGKPEVGSEEQQVAYDFACDGPITGYQLESNVPITGFSSAPLVSNLKGEPQSDSLSCSGEFPGWALNCVGSTKSGFETIAGQFSIGTALCAEPRVDPLLTVAFASGTGTYTKATNSVAVTLTQALSGPYDLGRPHGCPSSANSGGNRLNPKAAPKAKVKGKKIKGKDKTKKKTKKGSSGK